MKCTCENQSDMDKCNKECFSYQYHLAFCEEPVCIEPQPEKPKPKYTHWIPKDKNDLPF